MACVIQPTASHATSNGALRPTVTTTTAAHSSSTSSSSARHWPSLKLHFTLKRSSMQLFGQSEFDVYANPIVSHDGTRVYYDGYVDFVEETTRTRYFMVDGVAYDERTELDETDRVVARKTHCLPGSLLSPFEEIMTALNDVTVASTARQDGDKITCAAGHLFEVTFQGLEMVICASGAAGFRAYTSDIDIEVTFLKYRVKVPVPKVTAGSTGECRRVVKATDMTPAAAALLTGAPVPDSEERAEGSGLAVTLPSTTCTCKSDPRPCLFIHGLGNGYAEDELQDSMLDYWGNLTEHAPCCTEFKYMVWNSVVAGWNNDTQQQILCDLATSLATSSSSTEIADTIVVTHSMGGLALAGAIASGKCALANSSSWVALSAPMSGSMGSDFAVESCSGKRTHLMKVIGNLASQCSMLNATKSLLYQGGELAGEVMNDAYEAAQEAYRDNVFAAMCSNSYAGLFSRYLPVYWLLGSTLPHKTAENDGMVEFNSCTGGLPAEHFGDHYKDRFYKAQLNHADTTFSFGDGLFSSAKKPVKWFECLL
ncbi:unnamed protein product [Hyaloperonospora brassicae]|uniref:GPI inositol-deacylase n=2 Tax=Hyaloperonospora brassicae TaxID=162125 RepID=A0AAV0UJA0_HYABA|nr:unnamed protein product [Hyaloperonospora brassicae]